MSKIKVAVADDNKDFCDILCDVLCEKEDIEVCWVANDSRKALEEIERDIPDVLILDNIMPYVDGFEVLEQLNRTELERDCEYHSQYWSSGAYQRVSISAHGHRTMCRKHRFDQCSYERTLSNDCEDV